MIVILRCIYITRARINLLSSFCKKSASYRVNLYIVSARMRRDDSGEKTQEPEDSFHVGLQSVRET